MRYGEDPTPEERLVLLAARGARSVAEEEELRTLFERVGAGAARETARRNYVEAMVGSGLAGCVGATALDREWRESLDANRGRVGRLVETLSAVAARLEARGIRHAAIEGGGVFLGSALAYEAYGPSDIDLLVEASGWQETLAAFAAEGFVPANKRNRPTRRVEFRRELPSGEVQWLEVGYAPFDRMWVPLDLNHRCGTWLSRRVQARKGHGLFVLHPDDAVVCVALHTSLHSFVRAPGLRLHTDLDRAVRDNAVDWDRVVTEARALGAPTRIWVSLAMASALLGTPVPSSALDALAPSTWRADVLSRLLAREGVLARGERKLPRGRTILLDALLEEEGPATWLRNVLLPDDAWLREHFDRGGTSTAPTWALHWRRVRRLLLQWDPR